MHYLKRNTKFSILAFLVLILSVTISISTLAKTEVYFSFFYNSISPALQKPEDKIINTNSASQEELTTILQISDPLAQKIITLPHPITRDNQSRMGGVERRGNNNCY